MESLQMINWVSVVIATVVTYAVGAVWFMPAVFGNMWMQALGKTKETLGSPMMGMIVGLITTLLTAIALEWLFILIGVSNVMDGLKVALLVAIGISAFNTYSDFVYDGRPMKLFWIQQGYRVVTLVIMGVILGWM